MGIFKKEKKNDKKPKERKIRFGLGLKITLMVATILIATVALIANFIVKEQNKLLTERMDEALEVNLKTFEASVNPVFEGSDVNLKLPLIQEYIQSYSNISSFTLAAFIDNLGYCQSHFHKLYRQKDKFLGVKVEPQVIAALAKQYQSKMHFISAIRPKERIDAIMPIYDPILKKSKPYKKMNDYVLKFNQNKLFVQTNISERVLYNNRFIRDFEKIYYRFYDFENKSKKNIKKDVDKNDLKQLKKYFEHFKKYKEGNELIIFRYNLNNLIATLQRLGLSDSIVNKYHSLKKDGNLFSGQFGFGDEYSITSEMRNNNKFINNFNIIYKRLYNSDGKPTSRAKSYLKSKRISNSDLRIIKKYKSRFENYKTGKGSRLAFRKNTMKKLLLAMMKVSNYPKGLKSFDKLIDKKQLFANLFTLRENEQNEKLMQDFYIYYNRIYGPNVEKKDMKKIEEANELSKSDLYILSRYNKIFKSYKKGNHIEINEKNINKLLDVLIKMGFKLVDAQKYIKLSKDKKLFTGNGVYDDDLLLFQKETKNNLAFVNQALYLYKNGKIKWQWADKIKKSFDTSKEIDERKQLWSKIKENNNVNKLDYKTLNSLRQKIKKEIGVNEKLSSQVTNLITAIEKRNDLNKNMQLKRGQLKEKIGKKKNEYSAKINYLNKMYFRLIKYKAVAKNKIYFLDREEAVTKELPSYIVILDEIGFKGREIKKGEMSWNDVRKAKRFTDKSLLSKEARLNMQFLFYIEKYLSKYIRNIYAIHNSKNIVFTEEFKKFYDMYLNRDKRVVVLAGVYIKQGIPMHIFSPRYNRNYKNYYEKLFKNLSRIYISDIRQYLYGDTISEKDDSLKGVISRDTIDKIFQNMFGLFKIGSVRIVTEKKSVEAKQKEITNNAANIAIMIIIRVLILSFIIVALMVSPLGKLGEGTSEMGLAVAQIGHQISTNPKDAKILLNSGVLDKTIDIKQSDEIGLLADRFNNMGKRIRHSFGEMIEKVRMEGELDLAREIQSALMPSPNKLPEIPGYEFSVYYEPESESGGDYYDFVTNIDDEHFGFIVADVTNHGVGAAMVMAVLRSATRTSAEKGNPPATVLKWINPILKRDAPTNMFATVFYALMNHKTKEMIYAVAGHEAGIILNLDNGKIKLLQTGAMPVGVMDSAIFDPMVKQYKVILQSGEIFIQYSDGITEAKSTEDEEFGDDRFYRSIKKNASEDIDAMRDGIIRDVKEWTVGAEQSDDITLFIMKIE